MLILKSEVHVIVNCFHRTIFNFPFYISVLTRLSETQNLIILQITDSSLVGPGVGSNYPKVQIILKVVRLLQGALKQINNSREF